MIERWRDGTRLGTLPDTPWPWQAAVDRERQMLVVLDLDGALTRFGIEPGGLLPLGQFAAIAGRPAGLRERGGRVAQLVHGQWMPVA